MLGSRFLIWNIAIVAIFLVPLTVFALVDINTAGSGELQTLSGIGSSKAQSIIDYRETNGYFEDKEDIKNVSGIGDATYENIKNDITVSSVEEEEIEEEKDDLETKEIDSGSESSTEVPAEISVSNKKAVVGMPIRFEGYDGAREFVSVGGYNWNFGDGTTGRGPVIHHIYDHPGSYVVSLNYTSKGYDYSDILTVLVLDPKLSISSVRKGADGFVEINNNSEVTVDVSGWQLRNSLDRFIFPQGSYIAPQSKFRIDSGTLSLVDMSHLYLVDMGGNSVSSYPRKMESIPKTYYQSQSKDVSSEQEGSVKENEENLAAVSETVPEEDEGGWVVWFGALLAIIVLATGVLFFTPQKKVVAGDKIEILDE